jgi:hypothetical protein
LVAATNEVEKDPWLNKLDKGNIRKFSSSPQRNQPSNTLPRGKASPPIVLGNDGKPAVIETNTILLDPGQPLGFSVLSKVQEDARGVVRFRHVVHAVMDSTRGQAFSKGIRQEDVIVGLNGRLLPRETTHHDLVKLLRQSVQLRQPFTVQMQRIMTKRHKNRRSSTRSRPGTEGDGTSSPRSKVGRPVTDEILIAANNTTAVPSVSRSSRGEKKKGERKEKKKQGRTQGEENQA